MSSLGQLVAGKFFHKVISSHGQVVMQSSRHSQHCTKLPKFSGHADIKGHYHRAKFGCPRSRRL